MCRVKPLRDYCLFYNIMDHNIQNPKHQLVVRFAELVKKIWNPKNFKGHVSPHELLQAISEGSSKRFKSGEQKDPIQLLTWFFNTFSEHLTESGKSGNIITSTFQGVIQLSQLIPKNKDANLLSKLSSLKSNADSAVQFEMSNKPVNFFFLTLELPSIPLFKEQHLLTSIQQIPLLQLMKKFDGKAFVEEPVT